MGLILDKAILVLNDVPEICDDCPLYEDSDEGYLCKASRPPKKCIWEWKDETSSEQYCPKQAWCPLRYPIVYDNLEEYEKDGYKGGWNEAMYQIGAVTMEQAFPWMKED